MPTKILMDKALTKLTGILNREQEIYGRYFELLVEQQEYLVSNDLIKVRETIERINVLGLDAAECEKERRTLLDSLTQMTEHDEDKFSLGEILNRLEGPRFQELEKLRAAFRNIQEKIEAQKKRNELLIDHSMNMISNPPQLVRDITGPKRTKENAAIRFSQISRKKQDVRS